MRRLMALALYGLIVSCATDADRDVRTVYQAESMVMTHDNCIFFTNAQGNDFGGCDTSCLIYPGTVAPVGTDYTKDGANDVMRPPLLTPEKAE